MERREEGGRDAARLASALPADAMSDWTDEAALPAPLSSSLPRITNASHDFSFLREERARGGAAGGQQGASKRGSQRNTPNL